MPTGEGGIYLDFSKQQVQVLHFILLLAFLFVFLVIQLLINRFSFDLSGNIGRFISEILTDI